MGWGGEGGGVGGGGGGRSKVHIVPLGRCLGKIRRRVQFLRLSALVHLSGFLLGG